MVFEVRDLWPEAAIAVGALRNPVMIAAARWLESFAYRNSASIVALVERLKDGVVRRGYPAANVYVIPNGCDLDLFAVDADERQAFRLERPWLQDRFLIVYASTIGRVNVVEYLARLAASTAKRDPDVRFLVVGDGVERDHVQEVAKQLEVLDRSFFMEARVPKKAMPQLLAAADLAISLVATGRNLLETRRTRCSMRSLPADPLRLTAGVPSPICCVRRALALCSMQATRTPQLTHSYLRSETVSGTRVRARKPGA